MRQGNKLTARKVASLAGHQEKGLVGDGHGLYLKDGRSWLFRYMFRGRVGNMGLGPLHAVNLAEARTRARQAHQLILDGKDPLAIKQEAVMMRMAEAAKVVTFDQCATDYIASQAAAWKNAKHRDQWRSTLDTYASPVFGKLAVSMIDLPLVLKVLDPIWTEKPETASRLRGRIERILAWATVKGFRQGDNPARWQGNLDAILPAKAKVRAVKHHEAMAYAEVGTFMAKLRGKESLSAKALEFAILTATRTGEVIGATWDEIDLDAKLWTIPAERMKAKKEHVVPLSDRAIVILESLPRDRAVTLRLSPKK